MWGRQSSRMAGLLSGVLLSGMLLLLPVTAAMAAVQVEVNGQALSSDVPPAKIGGRIMVPLRGIFEALGAKVDWNAASRTIIANRDTTNVQLIIGNPRATVSGKTVVLDTPAMIIRGATMVPVRFVSEAMGAEVKWIDTTQTVSITTDKKYAASSFTVPNGTVIPVKLDKTISSAVNNVGDVVSATVSSIKEGDAEFPLGTHLTGVVQAVQRKAIGQPGMVDVAFTEAKLPDGRTVKIAGSIVSLDAASVTKSSDGRLTAVDKTGSERLKFIAIGAGAGLLIGKLTKSNTTTSGLLGAAAGYLYSEINKTQAADVTVAAGTAFGVRLDNALTYNAGLVFVDARMNYLRSASTSAKTTL
ncbi:MAG: copper amine oxidase N-terminal domain-containing protein [bacterium]|nr:copper amine oxidase N-terminal domain-containing protein [bacterium]